MIERGASLFGALAFKMHSGEMVGEIERFGRGSWIRTNDLQYPKLPRYQAALYPDLWKTTSIHAWGGISKAGADRRPLRDRPERALKTGI